MSPEEIEALKGADPQRYEALIRRERDQQLQAAAARWNVPGYASEYDSRRPTAYERQARAERDACRAIGEPEPPVYGSSGGLHPLTAEIWVNFNGSHLDLSRLKGGEKDCTLDLAALYTDLFNRLREAGIHFTPPADNTVSWAANITGPDGTEAIGGWISESRTFVLHADLALVPALAADVVAHEMVHQLISEYPQPCDHRQGVHGERFFWVARLVAEVLGMPRPQKATVAVWPTLDRPPGYYGPLVAYRSAVRRAA